MKIYIALLSISMLILFNSFCVAQNITRTLGDESIIEKDINVTSKWTNTHIQVFPGEHLEIKTRGTLHWFGKVHYNYTSSPDGQSCQFPGFLAQGLACWSLIGRIGDYGDVFQVGANYRSEITKEGELILGVNDTYYPDNIGDWHSTISITPPKCDPIRQLKVGDIIVYRASSEANSYIVHSGEVVDVKDGSILVESKWEQSGGQYIHRPEAISSKYGVNWQFYYTNRKEHNNILRRNNNGDFITDKGKLVDTQPWYENISLHIKNAFEFGTQLNLAITYLLDNNNTFPAGALDPVDWMYNCHGWTFTHGQRAIAGKFIQAILEDNNYCPININRSKIVNPNQ